MFRDVNRFVKSCITCQQAKSLTKRTQDLLQPLPVPEDRLSSVSMDFVTGLPTTDQGCDAIMVVVDRVTKVAHFRPTTKTVTGEIAANLFIDNIIRLHGLPQEIVSDKDLTLSLLWKTIQASFGTELSYKDKSYTSQNSRLHRWSTRTSREVSNRSRDRIRYEVGDWILLHKDAYMLTKTYYKLQPVYFGLLRIVVKSGEQAFEISIPITSKKNRIINSKWFRKFNKWPKSHPKKSLRTELEAIERAQNKEITGIVGYNKEEETYDVYWQDCQPQHSSTIRREIFDKYVPEVKRNSLITNLETLYPDLVWIGTIQK